MSPQSILRCVQRNPPRLNMPECDGDGLDDLSFSQRHGALKNRGGVYQQYSSSLAETKTAMATRTTRSAAATSAKKDDHKVMDRGHSISTCLKPSPASSDGTSTLLDDKTIFFFTKYFLLNKIS